MVPGERIAPIVYLFGDQRDSPPAGAPPEPSSAVQAMPTVPALEVAPASDSPRAKRRAENVSLAGLTRRNMSRWEIERLLVSRDIDSDAIAEELERLERVGLIDDAALAETLVRTRRERKGLGQQALAAELRRRHIDQAIIDSALDNADDDSEQQRANEVAEKRARVLESYDHETAKRRLTGFLMRKGYSSAIVQTAVAEALSGRVRGSASGGVRFR